MFDMIAIPLKPIPAMATSTRPVKTKPVKTLMWPVKRLRNPHP